MPKRGSFPSLLARRDSAATSSIGAARSPESLINTLRSNLGGDQDGSGGGMSRISERDGASASASGGGESIKLRPAAQGDSNSSAALRRELSFEDESDPEDRPAPGFGTFMFLKTGKKKVIPMRRDNNNIPKCVLVIF